MRPPRRQERRQPRRLSSRTMAGPFLRRATRPSRLRWLAALRDILCRTKAWHRHKDMCRCPASPRNLCRTLTRSLPRCSHMHRSRMSRRLARMWARLSSIRPKATRRRPSVAIARPRSPQALRKPAATVHKHGTRRSIQLARARQCQRRESQLADTPVSTAGRRKVPHSRRRGDAWSAG